MNELKESILFIDLILAYSFIFLTLMYHHVITQFIIHE